MNSIVNAAPMAILLGTDDKSTRQLVSTPEAVPTHLPKIYLYTKKGPAKPQLVVGSSLAQMYGIDSFDMRMPWATHATEMARVLNGQGNALMVERIQPADANTPASLRLYLDVLPTTIPVYQRESDGSYTLDVDGERIPDGSTTIAGHKVKWVLDWVQPDVGGDDTFGVATVAAGDQTAVSPSAQSQRYPILDLRAPYFGADGNNYGVRIWAPTVDSNIPLDTRILAEEKVYPFRMACVYRPSLTATPSIVSTQTAEQYVDVSFKANVIDKNTDAQLGIGQVFLDAYQAFNSKTLPDQYGPFGELHFYEDNWKTIADLVIIKELLALDEFSDLTADGVAQSFLVNLVSGCNSNGVPYNTVDMITTGTGTVRLSQTSSIYAAHGSDGTMNETLFAGLVATKLAEYNDPNSPLQDTAKYPESVFYDSGFPLATKLAMANFLAIRKDTFVNVSTYDVNGAKLTAAQDNSIAIALRTRFQMFPESDYFGTSVCRAMITPRSGKFLNSQYTKHLPLTFEIASKSAAYMGAGNGLWNSSEKFDAAPANQVKLFSDVSVSFTPASVRNKDWDAGIVAVQSFDTKTLFFPALKTVYDNDTSVLNGYITAMAIVELQKICERSHRQFTGSQDLTNAQLADRVNKDILARVNGRFDNRFIIKVDTFFTAADIARGYSWTTKVTIFAPNMKTVGTFSVEARRIEDLATA
jgi:hypothetical protein